VIARVAVVLLALTAGATAQPKSRARVFYSEGQKAYADGDFQTAAQRFRAAYDLEPDPAYLYNIAQAYRLAKQCHQSVTYYKRFLAEMPDAPNKQEVGKFLVEVTACARTQPEPVMEPQPPPPQPQPQPPPPQPPPPPIESPPSHLRKHLGLGGIALGAVGVGVGVVFGLRVESLENDRNALCASGSCPIDVDAKITALQDRASSARTGMLVGLIGGGAMAAIGTYLYVTGRRPGRTTVGVTPLAGGAFVTLSRTR
jgi:tetratricopeptide (TPR) repeat protein